MAAASREAGDSAADKQIMITTVIFDLDGLLADTERLHCRAYQRALGAFGSVISEAEYAEHWVRSGKGIVDWVAAHNLALDPEMVRARKAKLYLESLASELRPMDGALELLAACSGKFTLALASSSYPDAVAGVLDGLKITHYFRAVVSGLDVARVKPAPDIFIAAARQAGAQPSQCVVLEDAEKGVIAAHRAGMLCVAVPNDYTREHVFAKATRVCGSLRNVTPNFLASLGA